MQGTPVRRTSNVRPWNPLVRAIAGLPPCTVTDGNIRTPGEQVGLWALEQLDLPALLTQLGVNGALRSAATGAIVGRLAAPASERATHRWLQQRSGLGELLGVDFETVGAMQLYRASDVLVKHREAIEEHLFDRAMGLFDQQANQMRALISDLLDATHIETGTLSVAPAPSDLAVMVDQARKTFLSSGRRHPVQVDLPAALPRVLADRQRIVQVLGNLLSNAGRHSPESSTIRVAAVREGVQVAVSVTDEGRGIPAERLPHLFRKFARSGLEDRERGVGAGLGLAISNPHDRRAAHPDVMKRAPGVCSTGVSGVLVRTRVSWHPQGGGSGTVVVSLFGGGRQLPSPFSN